MDLVKRKIIVTFALCLISVVLFALNPTQAEAAVKRTNVSLNGSYASLSFEADEDSLWWDFTVPAAGKLTFTTQTFRSDTYFNLYNDDLTTKYFRQQFNSGSEDLPETQKYEIWVKAGTYHYRAADNGSNFYGGDGAVRVKIEFEAANETEKEINDTIANAMLLTSGKQVKGVLTKDDRYDFYAMDILSSGSANVRVNSYAETFSITIYDSADSKITSASASGSVESPGVTTLTFDVDKPGRYYIKVSDSYFGEDHTFGTYLLSWKLECTEHSYDSGEVTKAATCTLAGIKTYTCTACGSMKTETIPATGHKSVTDKAVAATCTTAGKTEGSHCSVCGKVITAQKVISATGHKTVTDKAVVATVFKAGKTAGSHCSVCGEILTAQKKIAKLKPTIKLSAAKKTIKVKKSFTLTISKLANGDSVKSVKSASTKIAKVKKLSNKKYKITGVKKGKVKITVTLKSGKKATCTVTVKK